MHIDYTKLTFEYFRREINRRRTTGHEVAAVVCIHPWKTFVHIQTCFWNRIEHVKRWYIRNVLSKKRLDNLKLFFLCNTLFLYVSLSKIIRARLSYNQKHNCEIIIIRCLVAHEFTSSRTCPQILLDFLFDFFSFCFWYRYYCLFNIY